MLRFDFALLAHFGQSPGHFRGRVDLALRRQRGDAAVPVRPPVLARRFTVMRAISCWCGGTKPHQDLRRESEAAISVVVVDVLGASLMPAITSWPQAWS